MNFRGLAPAWPRTKAGTCSTDYNQRMARTAPLVAGLLIGGIVATISVAAIDIAAQTAGFLSAPAWYWLSLFFVGLAIAAPVASGADRILNRYFDRERRQRRGFEVLPVASMAPHPLQATTPLVLSVATVDRDRPPEGAVATSEHKSD